MSQFDSDFAAYARPDMLTQFGRSITYVDPDTGAETDVTAIVQSEPDERDVSGSRGEVVTKRKRVKISRDDLSPSMRGRFKINGEVFSIEEPQDGDEDDADTTHGGVLNLRVVRRKTVRRHAAGARVE